MIEKDDLERFAKAQGGGTYERALEEIMNGRKQSHWIWYIFPQKRGLGKSWNSEYYGIESEEEARNYLAHPILGPRLIEISKALLAHKGESIAQIMGSHIDAIKLKSSMELFESVSEEKIFRDILVSFFQ